MARSNGGGPIAEDAAVRNLLESGRSNGLFAGAVAAVGDADSCTTISVGDRGTDGRPVTGATLFDVASLTKPVVTATIALRLAERGHVALDASLSRYVPPLADSPKGDIPVRSLLTHTSGLPPYKAFPFGWDSRETLLASLYESPISVLAPPDQLHVYSGLNFVFLADALRRVTGDSLAALFERHVANPAGLSNARLGPIEADADVAVAATRDRRWRERVLTGEIHDYMAAAADGESGNAGLFASASDLATYTQTLLRDISVDLRDGGERDEDDNLADEDGARLLAPGTIRQLREDVVPSLDTAHGLGWRLAAQERPGLGWSTDAFGHTGFTGTSIWIDPVRDRFAVLLTNHLLVAESPAELGQFRERFHAIVTRTTHGDD